MGRGPLFPSRVPYYRRPSETPWSCMFFPVVTLTPTYDKDREVTESKSGVISIDPSPSEALWLTTQVRLYIVSTLDLDNLEKT